jgi:hypothetical protein
MVALNLVGIALAACFLSACGDGVDQEAACNSEKRMAEDIASHAQVDGISAQGLCTLGQAEIATRLKDGNVWSSASDADLQSRAQQYVTNCGKLSKAKADCGD